VAFGCAACHYWYDRGPAPAEEKALAFLPAMLATQTILFREGIFR